MTKNALGIAINGQDIKVAEIVKNKNEICISVLENARLVTELECPLSESSKDSVDALLNDGPTEESFSNFDDDETFMDNGSSENFEILHALFKNIASKKIQTAFNAPADKVVYKETEATVPQQPTEKNGIFSDLLKPKTKKSKEPVVYNISPLGQEHGFNVYLDSHEAPIIQSSLEQLNSLLNGNLLLSTMMPNEVALVNLVNRNYNFEEPTAISAIIYIEESVSRIIFLKGSFFWFASPLYAEADDENINTLIYSKILFELDNHNMEHVSNIFLACRAVNDLSYMYFMENFPGSNVDLIISHHFAEQYSSEYDRPQLAEYAIPIALAFETLMTKDTFAIRGNLLPAEIINRHKMLKLSKMGFGFLGLLAAATLVFTYLTVDNAKMSRHLIAQNEMLQEQIIYNQDLVEQVQKLNADIINLDRSLSLSDSLGNGYDNLFMFLDVLNQSIKENKSLWIDHLETNDKGFNISGSALNRQTIPVLSKRVGYNLLQKVFREEINNKLLYNFEMDIRWPNKITEQIRADKQPNNIKDHFPEEQKPLDEEKTPTITNESKHLALAEKPRPQPAKSNPVKRSNPVPIAPTAIQKQINMVKPNPIVHKTVTTYSSFTIFVQGFFSSVGAEKLLYALEHDGIEGDIYQTKNSEFNYSVCVGQFASKNLAENKLAQLLKFGKSLQIIPLPQVEHRIESRFLTDVTVAKNNSVGEETQVEKNVIDNKENISIQLEKSQEQPIQKPKASVTFISPKVKPAIYQPSLRSKNVIKDQIKVKSENEMITELANNSIY